MFGISMWELLLVGLILFLVVGPSKLPGLAKQLGKGIKDLRRSLNDIKGSVDTDDEFVKAVRSAKQSVAEAKEAVRSIFDEEGAYPEPEDDPVEDPAPKRAPGGRKMVKAAKVAEGAPAPTEDEPVESEVWRADAREEADAEDGASPDGDGATASSPGSEAGETPQAAGLETEETPRKEKKPRRMVRPGKTPDAEADD